jgi:uncharacterized repeat protein (TIGR02543 family)
MKKCCLIVTVLLILTMILAACNPDTEGKTYTILYYGNGETSGIAPTDNNLYKAGETAEVLAKNTLLKTGYVFKGWNTKSDGTGTTYHPGETITVVNYDIFLHAMWGILP